MLEIDVRREEPVGKEKGEREWITYFIPLTEKNKEKHR